MHIGHLHDLQQARALGDYLIVGVIADEGITDYKRRPVIPFKERLELDANPRCVDEVVRIGWCWSNREPEKAGCGHSGSRLRLGQ